MDMQNEVREAILDELRRQAEAGRLVLKASDDRASVELDGKLDLDALVMVIAGSLAGGP